MAAFHKPSERDYRSVHDWIQDKSPLIAKEQAFIRHKEDVLTLHTGRESCSFDEYVETVLLKLDCHFIRVMLPQRGDQKRS